MGIGGLLVELESGPHADDVGLVVDGSLTDCDHGVMMGVDFIIG